MSLHNHSQLNETIRIHRVTRMLFTLCDRSSALRLQWHPLNCHVRLHMIENRSLNPHLWFAYSSSLYANLSLSLSLFRFLIYILFTCVARMKETSGFERTSTRRPTDKRCTFAIHIIDMQSAFTLHVRRCSNCASPDTILISLPSQIYGQCINAITAAITAERTDCRLTVRARVYFKQKTEGPV